MAYIACKILWESGFINNVSAEDGVKEINFNRLKLKVIRSYKKDEKITTHFAPSKDEDVSLFRKKIQIRGSHIINRKKLQRTQIKKQQTISRRDSIRKSSQNRNARTV